MIAVKNLHKSFGQQKVLCGINLLIPEGQIVCILGESGSGKSVLLQHMIGLMKPDKGKIEIEGEDIVNMSEKRLLLVRKKIGYLFQEGALYDFMTVFENVAFPLQEHTKMKFKQISDKVKQTLELVGLWEAAGKYPSELSGGMKKRAALARSVILDSRILFCDEPTSGLDPIKSREITELIVDISRKMKCTTVLTSHDIPNALRAADRIVLIKEGVFLYDGNPEGFRQEQNNFVQEFLRVGQGTI